MILVSPAMLRYLNDPTLENKAKLKPSDLVARDTFTGEKMKLEDNHKEKTECPQRTTGRS